MFGCRDLKLAQLKSLAPLNLVLSLLQEEGSLSDIPVLPIKVVLSPATSAAYPALAVFQ
jgi:hypothetical protein